jgi:hypothetical protein
LLQDTAKNRLLLAPRPLQDHHQPLRHHSVDACFSRYHHGSVLRN